jgi:hypothetical protein
MDQIASDCSLLLRVWAHAEQPGTITVFVTDCQSGVGKDSMKQWLTR